MIIKNEQKKKSSKAESSSSASMFILYLFVDTAKYFALCDQFCCCCQCDPVEWIGAWTREKKQHQQEYAFTILKYKLFGSNVKREICIVCTPLRAG